MAAGCHIVYFGTLCDSLLNGMSIMIGRELYGLTQLITAAIGLNYFP